MSPIVTLGDEQTGPAGSAQHLTTTLMPGDPAAWQATLSSWFLTCPGQSPGWDHYLLHVIHLRAIDGAGPPIITVPGATHEIVVIALDPAKNPVATDVGSWKFLFPINASEQVTLPHDDAAIELARLAARAVVTGMLPAEPPLAGAVEPWRSSMIKTSAHLRGEEHAP